MVRYRSRERLQEWVETEQQYLWDDLVEAVRMAANGSWSIQCEAVLERLISCLEVSHPVRPGIVPWALVRGGVYDVVTGEDTTKFIRDNEAMMEQTRIAPTSLDTLRAVSKYVRNRKVDPPLEVGGADSAG